MKNKLQKFIFEFATYTLLFCVSLIIFPICNEYYLGENESVITKPQYINHFFLAFLYPVLFTLVITGFLTLKKSVIKITNITIVVLLVLNFLYILILFGIGWGESPIHPDFQLGFWLCNIFVILAIVRTFNLSSYLDGYPLSIKTRRLFLIVTIGIPMIILSMIIIQINKSNNQPRSTDSSSFNTSSKIIYQEGWEYPAYNNAYISKYYSKDINSTKKLKLDSVIFTIMKNNEIEKSFTKSAKNGKLDIEAILEDFD